jgi:hypothetical protein
MEAEDVSPIRAIDLMRRHRIVKQVASSEEEYDVYKLEFTEEFNRDINETMQRLALDPTNESLNIDEGLKAMLINYIGRNANLTKNEFDKIKMMVFCLKTVQSEIE